MILRIAISLEITGFLLASIFGLILLNKEVAGKIAIKLDKIVTNFSYKTKKRLLGLAVPIYKISKLVDENKTVKEAMGGIAGRFFALVTIIIGLIFGISWVFWLGISWASFYVLITGIVVFIRMLDLYKGKKTLLPIILFPTLLCWEVLLGFIVAPFIINTYFVVSYGVVLIALAVNILMASDSLKKILIIVGSLMVAIGLILEAVAVWHG